MSEQSMIERVARAIFDSDMKWLPLLEHQFAENRQVYLSSARAAIAAMREPTEAMAYAGILTRGNEESEGEEFSSAVSWRRMIDAALKEE